MAIRSLFTYLMTLSLTVLWSQNLLAFKDKSLDFGVAYFSQAVPNKITTDDSGKSSLMGTTYLPFKLQYNTNVYDQWFWAPQLSYTVIPRSLTGDTGKVTLMHLGLPFGKNFESWSGWDWYVGPGLIYYEYKGAGGTKVMNNGTSTANFAIPGNSSTVKKITWNAGAGFSFGASRLDIAVIFENFFSNKKRTQNLALAYTYGFGEM